MRPDHERSRDDSLDAAIREALRVDADPLRVARLERYWRQRLKRQLPRQRAVRLIPLAAAAVLAFALFALTRSNNHGHRGVVVQAQRDTPRPVQPSDVGAPAATHRPNENVVAVKSALGGREPTAYERFILAARSTTREPAESRVDRIEAAMRQTVGDDASDPEQVLAASGVGPFVAETILLRKLPRSTVTEQAAILKLLTICGGQRSVPPLLRLGRHEVFRDEVLQVVQKIAGTSGLVQAAASAPAAELRTAAMLRLLTGNSEENLLAYLSLVRDDATRSAALATATDAPEVPILRLLACLDAAERTVRLAAATVLGHVNGPETTRLLIARVTEKPAHSTEAWLALMACRGEAAAHFLTYASHRPQLLGHLNNARVRAQMIP